jgi:putative transposase
LFSRRVILHKISTQNNTDLTINTFKKAYELRECHKSLSFNSDQGSNYTTYNFRASLQSLKVNQSFSKAGNPYDNACMESFYSSFKKEKYNSRNYKFFEGLQKSVDEYIVHYNNYKPHQALKNKTPNEYELEYFDILNNKKAVN